MEAVNKEKETAEDSGILSKAAGAFTNLFSSKKSETINVKNEKEGL
jgi:hypothetical protein